MRQSFKRFVQRVTGNRLAPLLGSILIILPALGAQIGFVAAQETSTKCQPPKAGEYLLLVVSPTSETQEQVRRALPRDTSSIICKYLNDTVTRIGGFTQIENANAQAVYINDIVGLSTFVAVRPAKTPPQNPPSYNPKPLGGGYAVLVDYFNSPNVATQVRQLLGQEVGLISYGQRPYLLAVHTSDQKNANSILQKLSDRGFFALLVDSRKVVLLRSKVVSFSN